jgi:D-sedoheptulose 7-phosphate isomerase
MTPKAFSSGIFSASLNTHLEVIRKLGDELPLLAERMHATLCGGGKVLWFGNGGSAADAQHLAAELVGRFRRERRGLASVALTTDTSVLTSIGNDYGFECVFSRQIEALCDRNDVVVGISTSGNSPNVCAGLIQAREIGAYTFAMTGESGGKVSRIADACLRVASNEAARIQEAHILAGHMLCDAVEEAHCTSRRALDELRTPVSAHVGGQ